MSAVTSLTVVDVEPSRPAPPTRTRRSFDNLLQAVERKRADIARWREFDDAFPALVDRETGEAVRDVARARLELLMRFDSACLGGDLTKREVRRMSAVIVDFVLDELDPDGTVQGDDEALIALHDRHAVIPFARLRQIRIDAYRVQIEQSFDVDLGAGPFDSRDAVIEALQAMCPSAADTPNGGHGLGGEAAGSDPFHAGSDGFRFDGPAARQREHAANVAERKAATAMRDIHRRLASALHPDREQDPERRAHKTDLMQQANQMHDDRDLQGLLDLQSRAAQLGAAPSAMADPQIKPLMTALRQQSRRLDAQLDELLRPYQMNDMLPFGRNVSPETVLKALRADAREMRRRAEELRRLRSQFDDIRNLKAWLDDIRMRRSR